MTEKNDRANLEISTWYEKKRDELLGLLRESTAVKIQEKYAIELREVTRKCQENSFEIALVGEFQGGKSTTFNALCDGREISPRGLGGGGIKTSAAVISAQNISNDEKKELPDGRILDEWAEITFKSDAAIVLSATTVLKPTILKDEKLFAEFRKTHKEIKNEDELKHKLIVDEGLQVLFDLKKNEHREILNKTVNILWNDWSKDKSHWNNWPHWNNGREDDPAKYLQDDLDQLRIVTLQLRFYETKEYKNLLSQNILPIDQFQKYIAFPKDWNIRWLNGANAEFTIEDVAFVFIHSVLVRLHSKNLQRLGCRITDCPGLFANNFDTQIARRTMRNADAIWYLINGDKMIGEKDLESIGEISGRGMIGKIEATCNLRGPQEQKIMEILPVTRSVLQGAGYKLEVYPYNAYLAFLAMQGDLILHRLELFSELDYRIMIIGAKAKNDNPDKKELWTKIVSKLGVVTEVEEIERIEDLDDSAVKIVRENSYFDNILSNLENGIILKKAKSILVGNGSERVVKALNEYEGTLKSFEDAAKEDVDKWKKKADKEKKKLIDFINKSERIIEDSAIGTEFKREQLANKIALDIINWAIDENFVHDLSHKIAEILIKYEDKFYKDFNQNKKIDDIENALAPIILQLYRKALDHGCNKWKESDDKDKSYLVIQNICDRICYSIRKEWEDQHFEENSVFLGINTPEISDETLSENCKSFTSCIIDNVAITHLNTSVKAGFESMLHALGRCFSFIDMIRKKLEESNTNRIEEMYQEIIFDVKDQVEDRDFLNERTKTIIQQLTGPSGSLNILVDKIKKQLLDMQRTFEDRVAKNEENFKKSSEERNKIAAENNKLRTNTIVPLRKRIEDFKNRVIKELGEFA